jgi:hypothetical protein
MEEHYSDVIADAGLDLSKLEQFLVTNPNDSIDLSNLNGSNFTASGSSSSLSLDDYESVETTEYQKHLGLFDINVVNLTIEQPTTENREGTDDLSNRYYDEARDRIESILDNTDYPFDSLLRASFVVNPDTTPFEEGNQPTEKTTFNEEQILRDGLSFATSNLIDFLEDPNFLDDTRVGFGEDLTEEAVVSAIQDLLAGDANADLEIYITDELNAEAAFAEATNTIFISKQFLLENQNNLEAIASVLLEEFGHYLDLQLNEEDSSGDEGAIFAELVGGHSLDKEQLEILKAEDDTTTFTIDGETYLVEQSSVNAGNCFGTSHIPSSQWMSWRNNSGATLQIARGNYNFKPTLHIAVNGQYLGQYYIPVTITDDVQVVFKNMYKLETFNGEVRQTFKPEPYLKICSNRWTRL